MNEFINFFLDHNFVSFSFSLSTSYNISWSTIIIIIILFLLTYIYICKTYKTTYDIYINRWLCAIMHLSLFFSPLILLILVHWNIQRMTFVLNRSYLITLNTPTNMMPSEYISKSFIPYLCLLVWPFKCFVYIYLERTWWKKKLK